jgi:hypothetical protein
MGAAFVSLVFRIEPVDFAEIGVYASASVDGISLGAIDRSPSEAAVRNRCDGCSSPICYIVRANWASGVFYFRAACGGDPADSSRGYAQRRVIDTARKSRGTVRVLFAKRLVARIAYPLSNLVARICS